MELACRSDNALTAIKKIKSSSDAVGFFYNKNDDTPEKNKKVDSSHFF